MFDVPVIDCDIHHAWRSPSEVLPYMSRAWQEFVAGPGHGNLLPISAPSTFQNPQGGQRDDALLPDGSPAGSDYETLRAQHLDLVPIQRGVLTYGEGLFVDSNPNPFLASEIARASNDWTIDQWLSRDERLYGSILVSNQDPLLAAAEIRRLGNHPRMCQVLMAVNGLGPAFGDPIFEPIHAAACECNLPLAIHIPGFYGNSPAAAAHGMVSFYFEYHVLITQTMQTHLVSFISNGVFEKYPDLQLVLVEGGVAWLPALMWRLDRDWKELPRAMRTERLPSEYLREHLHMTTQPLETAPQTEDLVATLESFDAARLLMFASDYPHWDTDQASTVSRELPKDWHESIFHNNAMTLYGWTESDHDGLARVGSAAAE